MAADEDQGSAYVFVRSGDAWTQQQRLSVARRPPPTCSAGAWPSAATACSSARRRTTWARAWTRARRYSFTRSHGAVDAEFTFKGGGARERNGYAVALLGTVAAIGAPRATANAHAEQGLVRTYAYVSGGWSPAVPVTPAAGAAGDWFGVSVALDGKSLIAGAYQERGVRRTRGRAPPSCSWLGSAGWTEQATLVASDGAADDYFGEAVAIEGDTALVGAS